MRLQALIDLFDHQVQKLVEAGVPASSIADALKVVATRTEILHGGIDSRDKLATVAERLRRLSPEVEPYTGSERRGPGRPWS